MKSEPDQLPSRNLALELVRVTETAAIAASRWIGRGEKNLADQEAVDAMRRMIGTVAMNGIVVIGEGEKDNAPMLYNGEKVGDGSGPACDVALDPIDGTTLTAKGMNNAISVIAVSERGSMFDPSAVFYMEKLVAGPESADVVDITAPDVAGAVMAARAGTGIDLLMGIGGTPEGIIAACAMKCLGGVIQGRLKPRSEEERERAQAANLDLNQVLTTNDLVSGNDVFFAATGITDGELLKGVRFAPKGITSNSIVMRSRSQTIRLIESEHPVEREN